MTKTYTREGEPWGTFHATGEERCPNHGEWFLVDECPVMWVPTIHGYKDRIILKQAERGAAG